MTRKEIELWARIASLQAVLERELQKTFRREPLTLAPARDDIIGIARAVKLPYNLSAADRKKLDDAIKRTTVEMFDGIAAAVGAPTPPRRLGFD